MTLSGFAFGAIIGIAVTASLIASSSNNIVLGVAIGMCA